MPYWSIVRYAACYTQVRIGLSRCMGRRVFYSHLSVYGPSTQLIVPSMGVLNYHWGRYSTAFRHQKLIVAQLWASLHRMRILAPGNEASYSLHPIAMIILALTVAHHAYVDEAEWNKMKQNGMKRHCETLPFHIMHTLVKRNGIVLNDFGKVFLDAYCTWFLILHAYWQMVTLSQQGGLTLASVPRPSPLCVIVGGFKIREGLGWKRALLISKSLPKLLHV